MEISPCYPGNGIDLAHGSCRFGVTRCVAGVVGCVGAVTPVAEICDGVDNDCDGLTDEGTRAELDVVVIVDNSGSMNVFIDPIRRWMTDAAARNPQHRYALVGAPAVSDGTGVYRVGPELLTQFGSWQTLAAELRLQDGWSGSGFEPTLDALDQVFRVDNPLGLERSSRRMYVIMFTDEEPQSYLDAGVVSLSRLAIVYTLQANWTAWGRHASTADISDVSSLPAVLDQAACSR